MFGTTEHEVSLILYFLLSFFCISIFAAYTLILHPTYIQIINSSHLNFYTFQNHYVRNVHTTSISQTPFSTPSPQIINNTISPTRFNPIHTLNRTIQMNSNEVSPLFAYLKTYHTSLFSFYHQKNPSFDIEEKYKMFLDEEEKYKKLPLDLILDDKICYADGRTFSTRRPYYQKILNRYHIIADAFAHKKNDEIIVTVIINLKHRAASSNIDAYTCQWWCGFSDPQSGNEVKTPDLYPNITEPRYITKVLKCKYPYDYDNYKYPLSLSVYTSYMNQTYHHIPFCVYQVPSSPPRFLSTCVMMQQQPRSEMIRWLLYKKHQGFEHITIYANEPRERYYRLLRGFIIEKYVDVIDWDFNSPFPFISQEVELADCVHRNRGFTKYLSLEDIDEFFQPRGNYEKIVDVVRYYDSSNIQFDALSLQNWFFHPTSWFHYDRFTFYNGNWSFNVFTFNTGRCTPTGREKIIIKPENAWTLSPHRLWQNKVHLFMSPTTEMRMVHYKWFFSDSGKNYDDSMAKYEDLLQEQYNEYIQNPFEEIPADYYSNE